MPADNKARAWCVIRRPLYHPPPGPRERREIPLAELKAWFVARQPKGEDRPESIKACCDELGASRDAARAAWAWAYPREEGETRGGYGKRLTLEKGKQERD
jgi:hypothetical protein